MNNRNTFFSQNNFTAFFINMDKDVTRRAHCEALLNDMEFDEVHRIVPIDINNEAFCASELTCNCSKQKPAYKNIRIRSINRPCGKYFGKPKAFKSATHSHQQIWKQIVELNTDDYYFVFEDDVELVNSILRNDFLNVLINDMNQLNEPKDFIYLGCCLENHIWSNSNTDFNNVSCWGAHAYMLNKTAAQYILDNVTCWHQYPDYILRTLFKTIVLGHQYYCPYSRGHVGYIFQGRKESWYTQGISG